MKMYPVQVCSVDKSNDKKNASAVQHRSTIEVDEQREQKCYGSWSEKGQLGIDELYPRHASYNASRRACFTFRRSTILHNKNGQRMHVCDARTVCVFGLWTLLILLAPQSFPQPILLLPTHTQSDRVRREKQKSVMCKWNTPAECLITPW